MKKVQNSGAGVRAIGISRVVRNRQLQLLSLAACAASALISTSARAASASWTGLTNDTWAGANWSTSPVPGTGDTAAFNNAGNAMTTIDLGAGVTVKNLIFDSSAAAAYTIGNGSIGSQTLTLNDAGTITMNSTVISNELFNSQIVLGTDSTAQAYNFTNNSLTNTLSFAGNITGGSSGAGASETLTIGGMGNTVFSGNLYKGIPTSGANNINLVKIGSGTFTVNPVSNLGSASGSIAINAGTLAIDFTNAGANGSLISSFSPVTLNGGTLQIIGNASNPSTQAFGAGGGTGVTASSGCNVISVGTNSPTLTMAGFAQNLGSETVFYGPATIGASGNVAATGSITTTYIGTGNNNQTAGAGTKGLLWNGTTRQGIATVGLYDWASTDTAAGGAGSSPYTIIGGSQVSGFYTPIASGTTVNADGNLDITGTAVTFKSGGYTDTIRFNTPGSATLTSGGGTITMTGVLVTPNVGANNTTITGNTHWITKNGGSTTAPIDVYQNNTSGELIWDNGAFANTTTITMAYVQGGPGTVVFDSTFEAGTANPGTSEFGDGAYLNGGVTEYYSNAGLGRVDVAATTGTVYLNGGTALSAATITLDNGGATPVKRAFTLQGNGGGLAAVSGNTVTVDGLIGSVAGTGPLIIGIPASGANGNTAGLVPGTGAGTANAAVNATGIVSLTGGNYYFGGTTVLGGATLRINGLYTLGGANYGGLNLSNGTLQYSPGFSGNGPGDLTTANSTGVSPGLTLGVGGGTIDTTNNSVTYLGSIGNGGPGMLTVSSNVGTGSLTLAGANTYTGGTNITSGTLNVTNTTGSGTGTGLVTINGGTLGGSGIISGPVNLSSGAIAPGAAGTTLTVNALNYTSGSLNFSINGSAGTASQISAGSVTFNAKPVFGPLTITGSGGLTNNEVFTVLTSPNAIAGSSYLTGLTPQNTGRFTLTPSQSGNSIIFTATGYEAKLVWQGGISGLGTAAAAQGDGTTWNDKQTTGASNFYNPNSNVNGYDYFYDLDNVTFNDTVVSPGTGSPGHTVNVASNVSPSAVTVSTAGGYTFFGTGSITGQGSVLVSSGSLTVENASNSYSGGTNISNGASLLPVVLNVLPVTGNVLVAGTLDLGGLNQSIGGLTDGGVSTGIVQSTGGSAVLTTNAVGTSIFSGLLQNGTGTLSLTASGTGTEILTGSNTYTGGTTINAGSTLQIGNNTSTVSLPSGQSVTDNGNLAFNLSAGTTVVSNTINGTGTVTQTGPAGSILQLSTANNYSGGTTIKSGTIQLTGATGIGTGDVTIASGSLLDLNGNSPTAGALNGAGTVDSSTAGTMVLTIGNNNDGGSFSGTVKNTNGTLSLVKAGTGIQILSGTSLYAGTTTLNAGTLTISGNLGSSGNSTGAIYVNAATLNISGNVYAPSLSTYNNAGFSGVNVTAGSVTLSGNLGVNQDTNGASNAALTSLTGGTVSVNSVTIDRSSSNYGATAQTLGSTGTGLYVNGATLAIATTLTFGDLGSRSLSSADMRIDSGLVTVGGTTIITDNNTRLSLLDVNGGTFTSNDTTGAGIQVGGLYAGGYGELLVSGTGTLNTNKITMGDSNQTVGLSILELIGGTTCIGSGGIAAGGGSGTNTINLGNATVATAPIIAATGNWSSSLPMTITNSSTASGSLPVNFLAQNSAGVAHAITLTGALTGTGGILKTGAGVLSLSGSNNYSGGTSVVAGTLVLASGTAYPSGTAQAGTNLTVGAGATVQVANHGSNATYVPIVSNLTNAGTVDLINNAMVVTNGSIGAISAQVSAAYNGGNWNGSGATGVITSSLAAGDSTHLTAVGVATGLTTTFEGVSVSSNNVLLKYTYYGDANLDGQVDGSDYSRIDNGVLMGLSGWSNGDFNYDGVINGSDYTLIDNAFNTQGANFASEIASATDQIAGVTGVSAVPEPTSLGLLGMIAGGLLGRPRRVRVAR